jgi:hypothetical protein
MRRRKNQANLTSGEWDRLVEAMRCFKKTKEKDLTRNWDWYVETHREYGQHDHAKMPHVPGSDEHIHIHSPFYWLAWHRHFIHQFENRLRRYDGAVVLPYWRWTVQREIPDALKSKLLGWMKVTRAMKHDPDDLPAVEEMQAVRNATSYEAFDAGLDALHARVHNWVGGDWGAMSSPNRAVKDPLFFLHHAYLDMIWLDWQADHPDVEFPSGYLDLELVPWDTKVRDVLDASSLDYAYE